jgi:hypothetical protein
MAGIPKVKITFDADFDELKRGVKGATEEVETFSSRAADFGKKAAAAFAIVGAAVTAFAVSAVKAAAEDEAAQQKLAQTLKATTDATQAQVEGIDRYITKVSIASARTDDELRPALSRLARSTGDVEKAQSLLTLSLDISAATGKSLEAVSNALARANEGNTTALSRLGLGIDATTLKNQSLDVTVAQLAKTYAGFSENEASTAEGKFKSLTIATDEVKESVGAALLPVITELATYILEEVVPAIQGFVAGLTGDEGAKTALKETESGAITFGERIRKVIDTVIKFKDEIKILAGVLATVFVVGKIAAFASSMISSIKLIVAAMNALRTSSILAGIAGYFALNPLLGVGIGAATIAAIAAFAALSRQSDIEIEARAGGGSVTGNRPYLVGEKGAELFVPTNNGSIIPNNRLSSGGQTVNINVSGAVDPISVARQIANILNKEATLNGNFSNLGTSRLVATT